MYSGLESIFLCRLPGLVYSGLCELLKTAELTVLTCLQGHKHDVEGATNINEDSGQVLNTKPNMC